MATQFEEMIAGIDTVARIEKYGMIICKHCGENTWISVNDPWKGHKLRGSKHGQGRCVPMPKVSSIPRSTQRRWFGPCFWDKPDVMREIHLGENHWC